MDLKVGRQSSEVDDQDESPRQAKKIFALPTSLHVRGFKLKVTYVG